MQFKTKARTRGRERPSYPTSGHLSEEIPNATSKGHVRPRVHCSVSDRSPGAPTTGGRRGGADTPRAAGQGSAVPPSAAARAARQAGSCAGWSEEDRKGQCRVISHARGLEGTK